MYLMSRTTTGYGKLKRGKPCEDAVLTKKLDDCVIMACADGHGDRKCKYAAKGAQLATWIMCKVLREAREDGDLEYYGKTLNDKRDSIIEKFVCEWVGAILDDYKINHSEDTSFIENYKELHRYSKKIFEVRSGAIPVREYVEMSKYRHKCEEEIYKITLLYGTTINALVASDKFVFAVGIGDGDVLAVNDKRVEWLLPQSSQFASSTSSLCGNFATMIDNFAAILIPVKRNRKITDSYFVPDLLMISTDGLRNAFLSDQSFADKIYEIAQCFKKGDGHNFVKHSQKWIEEKSEYGVTQDDVSFCLCTKHGVNSQRKSLKRG